MEDRVVYLTGKLGLAELGWGDFGSKNVKNQRGIIMWVLSGETTQNVIWKNDTNLSSPSKYYTCYIELCEY